MEIVDGASQVTVVGSTLIGKPNSSYSDESIVRAWSNDITVQDNILLGYLGVLFKGSGSGLDVSRNRMTVNKNGVVVQPNNAAHGTIAGNRFSLGTSPAGDETPISYLDQWLPSLR